MMYVYAFWNDTNFGTADEILQDLCHGFHLKKEAKWYILTLIETIFQNRKEKI